jgi:hypothetical protein
MSFDNGFHKGTATEFILAGQYYCDNLWQLRENVWRFHPTLWRQKNWLLNHDSAPSHIFFFTREFLTWKQYDCYPRPPLLLDFAPCYPSLFPQLKIKLKTHHFDTNKVIEAEFEAVLNIFREYDFQDAFKKMAETLGMVHTCRRGLLRGRWCVWPHCSTSPGVDSASDKWVPGIFLTQPTHKADNLTAIWEPQRFSNSRASSACYRDTFTLFFIIIFLNRCPHVRQ